MFSRHTRIASLAAGFLAALATFAAGRGFTEYTAADPVLKAFAGRLPPELENPDQTKWNVWSRQEDRAIRARLDQGDLDSMVNLLLYGTSFTKQPRIQIQTLNAAVVRARVDDLVRGLQNPGGNERLVFLRDLLRGKGVDPDATDGKAGLFVFQNLQRVLEERKKFAARVDDAKAGKGGSQIFRDRGVSLDTTILPNMAVEQALRDLISRGLLHTGGVERVAVIGPGLDFTDKDETSGYDYYPQQTLQPFAVYDSLLRLGLAKGGKAEVTVLDISSRVLDHLQHARERAKRGEGYTVQLPRDPMARKWAPSVAKYWKAFGDQAGKEVAAIRPPTALKGLETRAVRIRPEVLLACVPMDLDIVLERAELDRFDLAVATNILVYYDAFEQTLALQNVAAMLKPGGFLLSNDELRESPAVPMRRVGNSASLWDEGGAVGDSVFWYQKQ
jgi:SAM-dependent methyltransferase